MCLVTTRDCLSQKQFGIFGHDSFNVHVQTYPGPIKAPCSASAQECLFGLPRGFCIPSVGMTPFCTYTRTHFSLPSLTPSLLPSPFLLSSIPPSIHPSSLPLSLLPSVLSFFHPSLLLFSSPLPRSSLCFFSSDHISLEELSEIRLSCVPAPEALFCAPASSAKRSVV